MKKKLFFSLMTGLFLCAFTLLLGGCSEGTTATDYASQVVTLYGNYSDKFNEITEALTRGQSVTAVSLCNEAAEIIDEIDALEPPIAFKDEHKVISECCKKEKEKLDLEKEYINISKEDGALTDEQQKRVDEITERLSDLSLQSGSFYNAVDKIAGKVLNTQTEAANNQNMVGDI